MSRFQKPNLIKCQLKSGINAPASTIKDISQKHKHMYKKMNIQKKCISNTHISNNPIHEVLKCIYFGKLSLFVTAGFCLMKTQYEYISDPTTETLIPTKLTIENI